MIKYTQKKNLDLSEIEVLMMITTTDDDDDDGLKLPCTHYVEVHNGGGK